MKIVAGLGFTEEYKNFAEAGADEFFCGYVPAWWAAEYGSAAPLNRREVRNYNVQIGSFEDLKILAKMSEIYKAPVKIAINSNYYVKEQYSKIAKIIRECMDIGIDTFIIADVALIVYLRESGVACRIHLSGECAENNSAFLRHISKYGISRVIFHRKNSFADMKSIIRQCKDVIPEYEAFVLNELCHYTGAYCNSLHCDEMPHLCKIPYRHGVYEQAEETGDNAEDAENTEYNINSKKNQGCRADVKEADEYEYMTGNTGCGLCALYQLKECGITHLKVVGRGNYTDNMRKDIIQLKRALQILEEYRNFGEEVYKERLKNVIFAENSGVCSKSCYYL